MKQTFVTFILLIVVSELICTLSGGPIHLKLVSKKSRPLLPLKRSYLPQGINLPLFGNIPVYGEYGVRVPIGTPGWVFDVQVDTGSADLLIYAKDCDGCGKNHTTYDPLRSKTSWPVLCSAPLQCPKCDDSNLCEFDDQYGDGSEVKGHVYRDVLDLGGLNGTVMLGGITKSTPNFEGTGFDGIWGLGWSTISSWGGEPPFEMWAKQNHIPKIFSMCLLQNGGTFTINGVYNGFQWTPVTERNYFTVDLVEVTMNGKPFVGQSVWKEGKTIVDSGTTLIYLPSDAISAWKKALQAMCSSVFLPGVCNVPDGHSLFDGECFNMTVDDIKKFPVMQFTLRNVAPLPITPQQYLIVNAPLQNNYCLGILALPDGPIGEIATILGDVFIQGYHTVFDMEQHRVGFGSLSTCPTNVT